MRIGTGYDVHRMVPERALVLGGVEIPYDLGLLGHSDADVLVHAVMDALIGAAGLGDIGRHFPDTDPRYKGISSIYLLKITGEMLRENGYRPYNIDTVIVAERPKLSGYIPKMRENIAAVLGMEESFVNVKATTTEGLGFAGLGQGIAAYAAATIDQIV